MAEDLVQVTPDDDPQRTDEEPLAPPYQSRFQLILGVLLGIGLAAVAAAALFLAGGRNEASQPSVSWAPWKPTASDGLEAVKQIARHVGERYTLPSGNQLVGVRGGSLELAGLPVTIALQIRGDIEIVDDEQGVLYTFCGLGKDCSIKEGKPSVARHLVLRREAFELALYTFRYIKDVDQVVVLMPPPPGEKASQAMFYRRGDVEASLSRPLYVTLPGRPPAVNKLSNAQAEFINRQTAGNLFAFVPREGPDAHIYLVLSPIPVK